MSAEVVSYSGNEWDTSLSLMVECRKCSMEWGWSSDRPGAVDNLQAMADGHNAEHHP